MFQLDLTKTSGAVARRAITAARTHNRSLSLPPGHMAHHHQHSLSLYLHADLYTTIIIYKYNIFLTLYSLVCSIIGIKEQIYTFKMEFLTILRQQNKYI